MQLFRTNTSNIGLPEIDAEGCNWINKTFLMIYCPMTELRELMITSAVMS